MLLSFHYRKDDGIIIIPAYILFCQLYYERRDIITIIVIMVQHNVQYSIPFITQKDDPNEVELPLDYPLIPLRPDAQDAYYIIALLNPYPETQDDAMFFGIYYTRL